jgi:transmembrane sensor
MLSNTESLDLITRYLNNPSDDSLANEISLFRAASVENEAYFLEIESIWQRSEAAASLDHLEMNDVANKLQHHLGLPIKTTKKLSWLTAAAASILLFVFGYWLVNQQQDNTLIVKSTAANQIDSVKLKDGSIVILAENSEIKYPEEFDSSIREISLTKGKAFFKITPNPKQPFKVAMDQSDVVVLGTSFNIKLTASTIELGVKTGKVMFSPYKNGASSILTAGQALSYDKVKKEIIAKTAQNQDSWLTKELVFVDTPLEDVCKQLTEHYGVVIQLENGKKAAKKLNANFSNQSLDNVLEILNETYNINIKKVNNQIHLITP